MNIKELKKYGIELLNSNYIKDSIVITNILMEYCLNMTKHELIINDSKNVLKEDEDKFVECINRRINNEPLEYITNKKNFMNCELYVNENVLIPRNDTEILIENLISILERDYISFKEINILELCTGSGCIPIGTLIYLKEKNKQLYDKINFNCIDISEKALKVARLNVEKYNLEDKVAFVQSNLFENVSNKQFDIILSNPPYIESDVIDHLDNEVKNEPIIALDGGQDGLYFYREISKNAKKYLKDDGYIIYEIGYNQGENVSKILEMNDYTCIIRKKDLSNNDRNIIAKK